MRAMYGSVFLLLMSVAIAQPRLLLILVHEPLSPDTFHTGVPCQIAWMLWTHASAEPLALATGNNPILSPPRQFTLELVSPANAREQQHRLALTAGTETVSLTPLTLEARLRKAKRKGVYLSTPQSPAPSPYALIVLSQAGSAEARLYPSLEAMRLNFFQLRADWAVLELKRWNYRALELLLAEGVEVWVVVVPSPDGLRLTRARLSPVVRYAAREPRGLLTSPSTRWNGVIREVDLAPTLYRALTGEPGADWDGTPAFETRQSDWHRFWNGWLARIAVQEATTTVGIDWRGDALQRCADWAQAHQHLLLPIRLTLLLACIGWAGTGIALWQMGWLRGMVSRVFVTGIALFALAPAIAILYAYYPFELWTGNTPQDSASIAGWLTVCWLALSFAVAAIAHWGRAPLLSTATLLTVGMCCADLLIAGGYGVNRSLLSWGIADAYAPFGANEYFWAYALATGLLAPARWLESRAAPRLDARAQTALGMGYGLTLCLFALPQFGAALDAVLLMTLGYGLGIGWLTGVVSPQIPMRHQMFLVLTLFCAGIALTGLVVMIDALQPWQRQAGWAHKWLNAIELRFAPAPVFLITLATIGFTAATRAPLQRLGQRAYALRQALATCLMVGVIALLLGKVVASSVILALCAAFALECLADKRELGCSRSDGVAL